MTFVESLLVYDELPQLLDMYWESACEENDNDTDRRQVAVGGLLDNLNDMTKEDASETYEGIIVELLERIRVLRQSMGYLA